MDRSRALAPIVLAIVLSLAVLALFASWNKPLLYDEYVYFAAAGLPSTGDALRAVWETTTNLNQGVTGAFMMADYWLLQGFGAHPGALRFPGLLTGALLLLYAAVFLIGRRLSLWVLPTIPLVFATQELVLRYVGEARTYMPLAAATIGVLAYYTLDTAQRKTWWGRSTGWSAVLLGALFHPYFIVYWAAMAVFALLLFRHGRTLREFVNVPLFMVGLIGYVTIGALTWMRGTANAEVDPFNFLPGPLPVEIAAQNLYFLTSPIAAVGVIVVFAAPLVAAARARIPGRVIARASLAPILLIGLAFALALVISASTIVNDFWIFPRQWIASTALTALAAIWLVAEWWNTGASKRESAGTPRSRNRERGVWILISAAAIAAMSAPSLLIQAENLRTWDQRPIAQESNQDELRERLDSGQVLTDPEWISYAQVNIDLGGRVWPEFGRYYTDIDWTGFVLRDGSQTQ